MGRKGNKAWTMNSDLGLSELTPSGRIRRAQSTDHCWIRNGLLWKIHTFSVRCLSRINQRIETLNNGIEVVRLERPSSLQLCRYESDGQCPILSSWCLTSIHETFNPELESLLPRTVQIAARLRIARLFSSRRKSCVKGCAIVVWCCLVFLRRRKGVGDTYKYATKRAITLSKAVWTSSRFMYSYTRARSRSLR